MPSNASRCMALVVVMPSLPGLKQPVADALHFRPRKPSDEKQDGVETGRPEEALVNGESTKANGSAVVPGGETSSRDVARANGATTESASSAVNGIRRDSKDGRESIRLPSIEETDRPSQSGSGYVPVRISRDDGSFAGIEYAKIPGPPRFGSTSVQLDATPSGIRAADNARNAIASPPPIDIAPQPARNSSIPRTERLSEDSAFKSSIAPHRISTPPAHPPSSSSQASQPFPGRLPHRNTLEVPRVTTSARPSRELPSSGGTTDEVITATGRFSPSTPTRPRRSSMTLVRRATRSMQSDIHLDEIPQDEDAARWAEHVRQKRASKRKRKDDEDDDRVVVGTKVDQNHVNWVTAYNMLTGIRFTVSRTNAKLDRDLTDADFDAKHKFSFDM